MRLKVLRPLLIPRVKAVQVRYCIDGNLQESIDGLPDEHVANRFAELIPEPFNGPVICEQIFHEEDAPWDTQITRTRDILVGNH